MYGTPTNPSVFGLPVTNQASHSHRRPPTGGTDDGVTGQNTHCALFYADFEEQMSVVVPFLKEGLERDEHCVYVAHESTVDAVSDALRAGGLDVDTARAEGSLSFYTADEVHLRSGSFDEEAMLDRWRDLLETARDRFTGLRATGELTWAVEEGTPREVLSSYEAQLNLLNQDDEYTMLCAYNRTRFPDRILSDVIRTHPLAVSRNTIDDNLHFTNPRSFTPSSQSALRVDRALDRIHSHSKASAESSAVDRDVRESSAERILLAIADEENRRRLKEWLEPRYGTISESESPADVFEHPHDLCILDGPVFARYRDELLARKQAVEPEIVPFLLLHRGGTVPRDDDVRRNVEEIVEMPADADVLAWRIDTLLTIRELSLRLVERSDRIEDIASAAAHDLRNPLNVARGWLGQVEGNEDVVATIDTAHERMAGLIENVLAIADTGEPFTVADLETVDFRSLVDDCWEHVLTLDAVLQVEDSSPVRIRVEPNSFKQVFENLFRNAIKHGGDDVHVRVGGLEDGVGFFVEDDGSGIPPEVREEVFDRGYSTATGSGLGLTVVRRVAAFHGWHVFLTEGATGGARFEFLGNTTDETVSDCVWRDGEAR